MVNKASVCEAIKRHLRERIEQGDLEVGARVPSEYQLVSQLGVSRNQTRQALRELELQGYLLRRRGSGSYVAPMSGWVPALKAQGTNVAAMVFPQYISRYSRQVVEGFMQHMSNAGLQVLIYHMQRDQSSEERFLESIADGSVVGLVAWIGHSTPRTRQMLAKLRQNHFPVVLVDRSIPEPDLDFVVSDNKKIGCVLTQALIAKGHRRIGFLGIGHSGASSVEDRLKGYRQALEDASIPPDDSLLMDLERFRETPLAVTREVMALCDRPTAFCCLHDEVVQMLYSQLKTLGYRVPDNVALAAVDDDHAIEHARIPMVRVTQQAYTIGAQSAAVLLARMKDPLAPTQHQFIEPGPVLDGE